MFWIKDIAIHQPACPECISLHLQPEDGSQEFVSKEVHSPILVVEFTKPATSGVFNATGPETDTFCYLRDPGQAEIDYLARHRPGASISRYEMPYHDRHKPDEVLPEDTIVVNHAGGVASYILNVRQDGKVDVTHKIDHSMLGGADYPTLQEGPTRTFASRREALEWVGKRIWC